MTWHIHVEGQVQGVGFRPFIFSLAQKYGLNGWVSNTVDGVHLVCNANKRTVLKLMDTIVTDAPRLSKITSIRRFKIQQQFFDNFQIIHSKETGKANLLLTPDFALCNDCRQELKQANNRRYGYPFITCTNCGPRYSIIRKLPYDRQNTTMEAFPMCPTCQEEYDDPSDRRYFSQTNSCSDCGIELCLFDASQAIVSKNTTDILKRIIHEWKAGKIIAIKGIGGYLLTCDASNEAAVLELRKRKYRPSKPFALLYPTATALKDFELDDLALQELESHVSPIVLLDLAASANALPGVAPGLNRVGIMLPYTPLYELLMQAFGKPIVATSGNISNSPIVYEDEKALRELSTVADFVLTNNRDILLPQDDSLVQFSFFHKQKIVLRRSRGIAPTYINADVKLPRERILAMGAMLKSTFGLSHSGNKYISQYLGDLTHFDAQQNFEHVLQHFLELFDMRADVILRDQHPSYPSSQMGEQLSKKWNVPIFDVQHHLAHFGAIIGEHNLLPSSEPILGVIWDGTGLGEDGQIWGGEFFTYEKYQFSRCQHFEYFDFILGDKMPKEPRISALSTCWDAAGAEAFLEEKFSQTEWRIYRKMLQKKNSLQSSSVGRIFDAVASLLGIMDKQTYEGEAAMRLEALATTYFQKHGLDFSSSYFSNYVYRRRISTKSLMAGIIRDLQQGKARDFIAAKFHFSLAHLIKMVANDLKIQHIACSGGVFQNALLVDLVLYHLKGDFELYFHKELSPNDENISFGQLVCYQIKKQRESFSKHTFKSNKYVFSDSR
ncbi:MAG: carbamoyltransferase HypF [Bacteroidota bacterium]